MNIYQDLLDSEDILDDLVKPTPGVGFSKFNQNKTKFKPYPQAILSAKPGKDYPLQLIKPVAIH